MADTIGISETMALHMARQSLGWGPDGTAAAVEIVGGLKPIATMSGAPFFDATAVSRAVAFACGLKSQARLEAEAADASAAWRAITGAGSGAMGLTPDSVKLSAEYREAAAAYHDAAARLALFNGKFCKRYARELRAMRNARRASIMANGGAMQP
jgi:hypothetical protein